MDYLNFFWWNVQDFAHFDVEMSGKDRWPNSSVAFNEKRRRICEVIRHASGGITPELLAFCELTREAAESLQNDLLKDYELYTLNQIDSKEFDLALFYKKGSHFVDQDFVAAESVPRDTRPMISIDFKKDDYIIKFYILHWVSKISKSSLRTQSLSAQALSDHIYEFFNNSRANLRRHVVAVGDYNEEPYRLFKEWLFADRDRKSSRRRHHPTDEAVARTKLYNCGWRLLGESHPHPKSEEHWEMAGTHFWREENAWVTFDQVVVSGSLLGDSLPYLDESELSVVSSIAAFPENFLGADLRPEKFSWRNGDPRGLSDHLPIVGRIRLA